MSLAVTVATRRAAHAIWRDTALVDNDRGGRTAVPFSLSVPASASVFAGGRRAELNEIIQIDRDQQVLYATQFAVSLLCVCPLCLLSASPPLCLYLVLTTALCMALSKRL